MNGRYQRLIFLYMQTTCVPLFHLDAFVKSFKCKLACQLLEIPGWCLQTVMTAMEIRSYTSWNHCFINIFFSQEILPSLLCRSNCKWKPLKLNPFVHSQRCNELFTCGQKNHELGLVIKREYSIHDKLMGPRERKATNSSKKVKAWYRYE